MKNETIFLNELKMYILNYKFNNNNIDSYIIELFMNASIKCISINELRNILDINTENLITKNQYSEESYTFFSDIKKKLVFFDLQQIYDEKTINQI